MKYDIKPGVKGLIFDLDGTLADTMPYHFEGWRRACLKYGANVDNNFLVKFTGNPSLTVANEIIRNFRLEDMVTAGQLLNEKTSEFYKLQYLVKPINPVTDIVKKYHGLLPMSIGTGGHREVAERTLEVTGLRKYFDIVITANDINSFKPDPETFLKCSELMKIAPPEIEVFEDTDYGLKAALIAGMIATDVRKWYDSSLGNWVNGIR
jgi:beta-phosphoglucomutase-like phosphatase (HAD superfamily)